MEERVAADQTGRDCGVSRALQEGASGESVPKVIILKGLPGSGKTTWAKEQQELFSHTIKRVNKDELRAMLDDGQYSKENEKLILMIRDMIIVQAVQRGFDVIVDDTNLEPKHERRIRNLTYGKIKPKIEVKDDFLEVSLEQCLFNNACREVGKSVPEEVIHKMHAEYVKPSKVKWIPGLLTAIICDLDGTLAIHTGRSPYDYTRVKEDTINPAVASLLDLYHSAGRLVIFVSGRDDSCFEDTKEWLDAYNIPYEAVFMRKTGDKRPDTVIKREIYDKYIRGEYNISFVLDDRDRLVKMWRELGLYCWQVADGNF